MAALHFKHPTGVKAKPTTAGVMTDIIGITDMTITYSGDEIDFSSDDEDHISWATETKKIETIEITTSDIKAAFVTFGTDAIVGSIVGDGSADVFECQIKTADAAGKNLKLTSQMISFGMPKSGVPHAALATGTIVVKCLEAPTVVEVP